MEQCKLSFHGADYDTDSNASDSEILNFVPVEHSPLAAGPWRPLTPLQLRDSGAASDTSMLSSFNNGLFSPTPQLEVGASGAAATDQQAPAPGGAADEAHPSHEMLHALQERIDALELEAHGVRNAASGSPPPGVDGSPMGMLIEDVDRSLSDLQQTFHGEAGSSDSLVETRVQKLRWMLHERRAQGLPSAAGEVAALRAELARLTDRLSSEMQDVREFVTMETTDVCAFVEERLEEFAALQPPQQLGTDQQGVQASFTAQSSTSQALAVHPGGSSWGDAAPGQWSPASGGGDGAILAQMPRNVQELWHYLQRGMQHVEGLRLHTEEHLAAVNALCEFADARLNDINALHDRFEERIEDLQASHRESERKLARLHSQQAQASGQLQALSFAGAVTARPPPPPPCLPDADASMAFSGSSQSSVCIPGRREEAPSGGWQAWAVLNFVVLLAVAALLAAVSFSNEPMLVAT